MEWCRLSDGEIIILKVQYAYYIEMTKELKLLHASKQEGDTACR